MKVACGWDHRGFRFRERLAELLARLGHELLDLGAQSEDASDYPDFAFRVAEAVVKGDAARGILICGSGIGMCIAANKVRGIRAALVASRETARLSRAHNDANVLCLDEVTVEGEMFEPLITTWLTTEFDGGRHARRVDKIIAYEKNARPGPAGSG